jgi:hypothetical protein
VYKPAQVETCSTCHDRHLAPLQQVVTDWGLLVSEGLGGGFMKGDDSLAATEL